jgi:hypothetical protein
MAKVKSALPPDFTSRRIAGHVSSTKRVKSECASRSRGKLLDSPDWKRRRKVSQNSCLVHLSRSFSFEKDSCDTKREDIDKDIFHDVSLTRGAKESLAIRG